MPFVLPLRRRREKKTDYRKRLKLLKSGLPRLVIRRSNLYIRTQLVEYNEKGDLTKVEFLSKNLKKFGWNTCFKNLPASYLTGYAIAKIALKKGFKKAVVDTGLHRLTKGCRIYACIKGAVDGGLEIPHSDKNFPDEDRIMGKHISEEVVKKFEEVKNKIDEEYGGK